VLYKDNIDTIQAVNMIAKSLRIQSKRINYAGTKDKRAKTTQLLSFFK
jgi:tRNA pseudouridine13 synthase